MEKKILGRELSRREKILLIILIILLVESILYFGFIKPQENKIANLKAESLMKGNELEEKKLAVKEQIETQKEEKNNFSKDSTINSGSVIKALENNTLEVKKLVKDENGNSITLSFSGPLKEMQNIVDTLGSKGRVYDFNLTEEAMVGTIFAKTDENVETIKENESSEVNKKSLKDIFLKKDEKEPNSEPKTSINGSSEKISTSKTEDKEEEVVKNSGKFYIETTKDNISVKKINDMLEVRYTNLAFKNNFSRKFIDLHFKNLDLTGVETAVITFYPEEQRGSFGYMIGETRKPIFEGYIQQQNNKIEIPNPKGLSGFYYDIDENTDTGLEDGYFYLVQVTLIYENGKKDNLVLTYIKADDEEQDKKEIEEVKHKKKVNKKEVNDATIHEDDKNKD